MIPGETPKLVEIATQRAGAFFRWWGRELAACVPSSLPASLGLDRNTVWISFRETSAVIFAGHGPERVVEIFVDPDHPEDQAKQAREIVESASADRIGLILSPKRVLRPTVKLPIAASENLREVVGFEMDRHTPFRAAEVFYDFRVRETDRQSGQLTVEIVAAPRETVDRALALAAAWGLSVDRITVADDDAPNGVSFNLLSGAAPPPVASSRRRLIAVEAALACALAAIAVFLPIKQKRDALAAAETELAIVREQAAAVGDLRDEMLALSDKIAVLVAAKKIRPKAVALLNEITRILPDGTWLSELSWEGNDLYISGFSDQPSSLIGALEASPMFGEARFSTPVTAAPQLERERFDIALVVTAGEDRK